MFPLEVAVVAAMARDRPVLRCRRHELRLCRQAGFRLIGAADAQLGKPSAAPGSLGCNASYEANIGLPPVDG